MIKVIKTEAEWKKLLTRDEFRVLRQAHTEKPFSGKYNDFNEEGLYVCAACGTPLFDSSAKYDHGTGWPSLPPRSTGHISRSASTGPSA